MRAKRMEECEAAASDAGRALCSYVASEALRTCQC
jgi:hypothetical protein